MDRGRRRAWRFWGMLIFVALICAAVYFLIEGYPLTGGFISDKNLTRIVVKHGNESVELNSKSEVERAYSCAATLGIRFPLGEDTDRTPDIEYLLYYEGGTRKTIGVNENTVFINGKAYGGVKRRCKLLLTISDGFYFPDQLNSDTDTHIDDDGVSASPSVSPEIAPMDGLDETPEVIP